MDFLVLRKIFISYCVKYLMQTFAYVDLVLLYFAGVLCVFNALFECKNATFFNLLSKWC